MKNIQEFSNEVKKKLAGFTYMEVMFSIFLLSVGIISVMILITSSIRDSLDARDQQIAVMLAQEGLELARNVRDNNWAREDESFDNLPANDRDNCSADKNSTQITDADCSGSANSTRLFFDSNNFYVHSSGSGVLSKFRRRIMFRYYENDGSPSNRNNADYVEITSVAVWGNIFPSSPAYPVDSANCSTIDKCAFVKIKLEKWGE